MKLTSHQIMTRAAGLAAVLLSGLVFAGCEHTAPLQHHTFRSEPAKVVQHAELSDMMANYTYANPHTGHLWGSDGFDLESDEGADNQDTTFIINDNEIEIPINGSSNSDVVHQISPNGSDTRASDYDKNSDEMDSDGPEVGCHFDGKTLTLRSESMPLDEAKKTLVYAKYRLHDIKHISSTDPNRKKFHHEIELVLYPLKYKRNNGLGMHNIPKWQRAHYALYLIRNKPLYYHKGRYSPSHNDGRLPY